MAKPPMRALSVLGVPAALLLAIRQLADGAVLRVLGKSLAVSLALFALLGWAGWQAIDAGFARFGLADGVFAGADAVRGAAAAVLAIVLLWLVWRIVAMAVIGFFADEVVEAVEARHYPHAASMARDLSLAQQVRIGLRSAVRALLVNLVALPFALALLFTGVGTALVFYFVNAWLLGRELQDMVWLRHAATFKETWHAAPETASGTDQQSAARPIAPLGRAERFALGAAIAGLLLVPFVTFLAPVLGAASAAHLVHRNHRTRDRS